MAVLRLRSRSTEKQRNSYCMNKDRCYCYLNCSRFQVCLIEVRLRYVVLEAWVEHLARAEASIDMAPKEGGQKEERLRPDSG